MLLGTKMQKYAIYCKTIAFSNTDSLYYEQFNDFIKCPQSGSRREQESNGAYRQFELL